MIADLTAEAVKRATDIAFARTLANATDSAGTQTAIALTPTGTSPPTERRPPQPLAAARRQRTGGGQANHPACANQ